MEIPQSQTAVPELPALVEVSTQPSLLDGGKKTRRSRSRSRSRSPAKKSKKSRKMKMRGGEYGRDAYGHRDLGANPTRKNFGLSGLTNDDYEAFQGSEGNPYYVNVRDKYEDLQKLHKQMMRSGLHAEEAKILLDRVLSYNAIVENGELPDWVKQYAAAVDEKLQQTKFALDSGDKSLARSYEWQALVEEKRLAYMIMEALSNVAIGSGEGAKEWRRTRAMGYEDPLPSNAIFSALIPRSYASTPIQEYTTSTPIPEYTTNSMKYNYKAPKYTTEQLAQLKANEEAGVTFVPKTENSVESPTGFQNIFSGGRKKCKKYQRRSRSTGHCVGQKKKSVSRRR